MTSHADARYATTAEMLAAYEARRRRLMGAPAKQNAAPDILSKIAKADAERAKAEAERKAAIATAQKRLLDEKEKARREKLALKNFDESTIKIDPSRPMTMATIAQVVVRHFPGVSVDDVKGRKNGMAVRMARRVIARMIHEHVEGASFSKIGQFLGGRDHSTVLSMVGRKTTGRCVRGPTEREQEA